MITDLDVADNEQFAMAFIALSDELQRACFDMVDLLKARGLVAPEAHLNDIGLKALNLSTCLVFSRVRVIRLALPAQSSLRNGKGGTVLRIREGGGSDVTA